MLPIETMRMSPAGHWTNPLKKSSRRNSRRRRVLCPNQTTHNGIVSVNRRGYGFVSCGQIRIRLRLCRVVLYVAKNVSTRSIVKKKRRKPQTSQDKAVATNYHSRQTSGKNQSREFFTIHFHDFFHCFFGQYGSTQVVLRISKTDFGFFPALQNERQFPRKNLSHTQRPDKH